MGVHALVIYCMKSPCVCAAKYIKNEFLTRERVIYRSRKNHGAAVVTNLGSGKISFGVFDMASKKKINKRPVYSFGLSVLAFERT